MPDGTGSVGPAVLVALQGNETDAEVLRLACRLAQERRATLRGLYVIEVPQARELGRWQEGEEERARLVLAAAGETVRELGCTFDASVLPARDAARAIVDESVEWAVDAVVLAAPFKSRSGDAALYVLERAVSAVVLFRPSKQS